MDFDHHFVDLAVNYKELDFVDHQSLDFAVHIVDFVVVAVGHDACILRCSRSRFSQLINRYSIWNSTLGVSSCTSSSSPKEGPVLAACAALCSASIC